MGHPQIAAFARLAKGDDMPMRVIAGQHTRLSRTMHDVRFDAIHDELYVTNPFAEAVLVFHGSVNGDEAPIRIIQGSKTDLSHSDRLEVDPIHNEIIVPSSNRILVFPRTGNGNVAPIRVIEGPKTELRGATAAAVDPIHNLLIVGLQGTATKGPSRRGGLLIFKRTANGDVAPLRVIRGPKSGIVRINQMVAYPPRKFIVATQPGEAVEMAPSGTFVGVWSMDDNGDVPPLWKIDGNSKTGMIKPRGVMIDAKHKEIIVADMRRNAVLTFYLPEMF